MSSTTAVVDQEIAAAQTQVTLATCIIAVTTLLVYDTLLTLGQEYQYIWRAPKSYASRILYVWNRYTSLAYNVLNVGSINPVSDTSCVTLGWVGSIMAYLSILGPGRRTGRWEVALVLSLAPFVMNMVNFRWFHPINLPAPFNCALVDDISKNLYTGFVIASRSCLILVDSLAVAVTWYQARSARTLGTDTIRRPSLEQVMWENGSVYFCTLVSMNVVDMVLVIRSTIYTPGYGANILTFIDPISSILNSRFLLALHETNARLEGANTSISSISLNIDSDGGPRDGSPELPEFLAAVGGPIHSFPDHDDEDWGSVEFTAPSQGGDSEVAAEVEAGAETGAEGGLRAEGGTTL